jgi:hypothetical protein
MENVNEERKKAMKGKFKRMDMDCYRETLWAGLRIYFPEFEKVE